MKTPTVAILAMPQSVVSTVYGMYDLFMSAGRDWGTLTLGQPGPAAMRPEIVSRRREAFTAVNDGPIAPHRALSEGDVPDVICIPDIFVTPGEPLDQLFDEEIAWLQRCHAAGSTLATACSGALLLAEAGLLDGREATTHWAYCDALQRRFPKVKVQPQRALVVSGEGQRLVMAGGGVTWLDLALYLIARFSTPDTAMQVARLYLIDWHVIGQQPFASLARSRQVEDAEVARCQTWIADHYQEPSPVLGMVRLSGLPERSFKRRFRQATGMSPLEYVHTLRLEEAKHMLESSAAPVEAIANEVGYEDAGFFSRLFRRQVSLTPAQYRRRFGSMRKALNG
jgi:transcriptional regulator GlxA family with amidase domain